MKTLVLATVAVLSLMTVASAADRPVETTPVCTAAMSPLEIVFGNCRLVKGSDVYNVASAQGAVDSLSSLTTGAGSVGGMGF